MPTRAIDEDGPLSDEEPRPQDRLSIPAALAREEWIGPPPWLNAEGRRWWEQMAGGRPRRPGAWYLGSAAALSTMLALVAMIGASYARYLTGGSVASVAATEWSITLCLSTAGSMYFLSCMCLLCTGPGRALALETFDRGVDGGVDLGVLLEGLGLAIDGAGLVASDHDRLWALERLEVADARHMVSVFGFGFLRGRALTSERIPELYGVLTDAVLYPTDAQVDDRIRESIEAVAQGRTTDEDLEPLLELVAAEGSQQALDAVRAAYGGPLEG